MKLNRLGYLIGEGMKGIFSHGFRSFATVTIIVACLVIMGSFSLLSINVDSIIEDLEQQSEVLAFVDETYPEADARALEAAVRATANVRDVKFITRGEAMESYKAQFEDQSIFETVDESVFRDRYVIHLNDVTRMGETRSALRQIPGIVDVSAHEELAEGVVTVRNVVSAVTVVLVIILLVVSIFIIANTIKLAAFTRREEIAIMKMVGASNGFIRLPYIVEGLALGLIGGLVAFLLEWAIYKVVMGKVMAGSAGVLFKLIPFTDIFTPMLMLYLGVGLAVGAIGGAMAIRNYLKV